MKRKLIGISCGVLARRYGDIRALEMCADAGFDAVDFNLMHFDVSKDTIYLRSDEEIVVYFEQLKRRAEELGLIISQTHGRTATYRPSATASPISTCRPCLRVTVFSLIGRISCAHWTRLAMRASTILSSPWMA